MTGVGLMEERIGILWHHLASRLANRRFPASAVRFVDISREIAIWFRAFGGSHALVVQSSAATRHGARRSVLERIAGTGGFADLAWVDQRALRLPVVIDVLPEARLNRDLYFWLTAMCARERVPELPWFVRMQLISAALLRDFSGLARRYRRLAEATIALRPDIAQLAPDAARQERVIRTALLRPGTITMLPAAKRPFYPILLWLRPDREEGGADISKASTEQRSVITDTVQSDSMRRRAECVDMPKEKGGPLLLRPESIFSWTEYAKVEHETSENTDPDLAHAADEMDVVSVTRDGKPVAKKLRMELDLVATEIDDIALAGERMFPEWDYRKKMLKPDQCRVRILPQVSGKSCPLPDHLRRDQFRLRRQFSALLPVRKRVKAQMEGADIDIDSYIRHIAHEGSAEAGLFIDQRRHERDLACLVLADLSLSTEAWIGMGRRVIDVIRDGLFLFSETLSITKDCFALYGFSSRRRTDVCIETLKEFEQPYDATVRGAIWNIGPKHYTRMGAAIRQSSAILGRQKARVRLLLLLTDGKPNDIDHYEGRYGIEDTRNALLAAQREGIRPFCVTIDQGAQEYLPYMFGRNHFVIIRNPSELPVRLPLLYGQLSR